VLALYTASRTYDIRELKARCLLHMRSNFSTLCSRPDFADAISGDDLGELISSDELHAPYETSVLWTVRRW
jgi:hypothetical protein